MAEYIEREKLIEHLKKDPLFDLVERYGITGVIESIPAADVRPVVLCGVCELHGHCYTEDVFAFARLAEGNRFCSVGKVKTNGAKREES